MNLTIQAFYRPRTALKVLRAIDSFIADFGYSPSFREIQFRAGLGSTQTVTVALRKLADLGLVTYRADAARTVRLTEAGRRALQ